MFLGNNFYCGLTIITIFLPLLAYGQSSHEQGMANNSYVPSISARIVNGTQSVAGQFPYVVSVRYIHRYDDRFLCGGTILNKYWVIMSAHCLHYPDSKLPLTMTLKLIAGENAVVVWWKAKYKRSIRKIVVHPDYPEFKYQPSLEERLKYYNRDAALLMVRKPWVFNDYVKHIEIISHSLPANASCVIAGYGLDNHGKLFDLYYSIEYLYGNDFCRTHIPRNISSYYEYPDGTVCAGNLNEYTGPCWGDCGAPLVCDNRLAGMLLAYLPNYDVKCGSLGLTNIYFDVKYHRNWIQKEIHIPTIKKNAVKTSKTHTLHDSSNSFFIVHSLFILYIALFFKCINHNFTVKIKVD